MPFFDLMRLNISIFISLDQLEPVIEINLSHNSDIIRKFLRNLRHSEVLEKYDNVKLKVFDNFGDIETRYITYDMLVKIKKDNIEIEQKEFLRHLK